MGPEATLQLAVDRLNAVRREIAKVIVGQDDVVEGVLICLLASGHVLLESVPGLGKTTLLRTLARALHLRAGYQPAAGCQPAPQFLPDSRFWEKYVALGTRLRVCATSVAGELFLSGPLMKLGAPSEVSN